MIRDCRVIILILILMLCPIRIFAQGPDTLWTKAYGGADDDGGRSILQTEDGGYIVAGISYSFSATSDAYVIRTDSFGDSLWSRIYGGDSGDWASGMVAAPGGGFVLAGGTYSYGQGRDDVYIIKIDEDGDTVWTKTYGTPLREQAGEIKQTPDGGYITAGITGLPPNAYDIYIIKMDSLGDSIWTRTYGGTSFDQANSIQLTADGGYVILATTNSFGAGSYDFYLIVTDSIGDTLWTKTYGGGNADWGRSVAQTPDGGYILAGYTNSFGAGSDDIYLVRTDAAGDTLWTKTYGGVDYDRASSLELAGTGYILVGWTMSFGAGSRDVYFMKLDSLGDTLWTKTYGESAKDEGSSFEHTTDGGYIIVGLTRSYGSGFDDFYLIKTVPETGVSEYQAAYPGTCLDVYPNPFNDVLYIIIDVGKSGNDYALQIYDIAGRLQKSFPASTFGSVHENWLSWNGRNDAGEELPNGVYFLSYTDGSHAEIRKLLLLR